MEFNSGFKGLNVTSLSVNTFPDQSKGHTTCVAPFLLKVREAIAHIMSQKPLKINASFNNRLYFKNRILCYACSLKIYGIIWLFNVSLGVYLTTFKYRKHVNNNITSSLLFQFMHFTTLWNTKIRPNMFRATCCWTLGPFGQ